jgi:hypothetical protein
VATTVPRRHSGDSVCANDRRAVFAYRAVSPLTVLLPSMIEDCLGPTSMLSTWTIGLLSTTEDRADKFCVDNLTTGVCSAYPASPLTMLS